MINYLGIVTAVVTRCVESETVLIRLSVDTPLVGTTSKPRLLGHARVGRMIGTVQFIPLASDGANMQ